MRMLIYVCLAFLLISCAGDHYKFKSDDINLFVNLSPGNLGQVSVQNYFAHYYSPWTNQQRLLSNDEILNAEQKYIKKYTDNPGWAENTYPHDTQWIHHIINNMDIENFPNTNQKAMVINNTNVRSLPSAEPSFGNPKEAGEGYPFDNFQESTINANTPVLILHTTTDKSWSLILSANEIGWVPSQDIIKVDSKFIRQWQKKDFVAITKDQLAIVDKKQFLFQSYLGSIFPLVSENKNQFIILVADHSANLKLVSIDKDNAVKMPLAFTAQNMGKLIETLMGNKYGWGGIYHYRDCSATLEDLFTPFGIWLPRNSHDQIQTGKFISLENLNKSEKEKLIKSYAVPFKTLIGYPGHIMLYVGQYQNKPYVFQNLWGLHTSFLGKEGRAVIGQTIISPLDLGKYDINVPKTQLEKATGMSLL